MATGRREKSINELRVIGKVSLVDYYNDFLLPLNPKFTPMVEERGNALCPFHEDTDPSLYGWKNKHIYHCFGCSYTGDVVGTHIFMMRRYHNQNMSVKDAVEQLANKYGIDLDADDGFVVKSVYDVAREQTTDLSVYDIPVTKLTISEFDKNNRKVIKSNYPLSTKISTYGIMDLVACVEQKERD